MKSILRTIIVDDEPLAREALVDCLSARDDVEIVAVCVDGPDAIEAIGKHDPDLLFLDVQMPEVSGFDVIDRLDSARVPLVVFVTAYDDFAMDAFHAAAVDYVLKPLDDERIARAVERAKRMADGDDGAESAERPASAARGIDTGHATRVKVRDGDHIQFIRVDDVEWFEADGNYVVLHQKEGEARIRATLTSLEESLDPSSFVRVHRSAMINIEHLKEVQPWFSGDYLAIMLSGQHIRVSRRYRDHLLRDIF